MVVLYVALYTSPLLLLLLLSLSFSRYDCYSGQSTRFVPGGRVSGWGSQNQELDGNTKTQGLRQVQAAMSVIPYVLCGGLYCLWC